MSDEDDERARHLAARAALHAAIVKYAADAGYGVVTKWVVACETNDGRPVMRHRSGDVDGAAAAPWDELALHRAGALFAEAEMLRQDSERHG